MEGQRLVLWTIWLFFIFHTISWDMLNSSNYIISFAAIFILQINQKLVAVWSSKNLPLYVEYLQCVLWVNKINAFSNKNMSKSLPFCILKNIFQKYSLIFEIWIKFPSVSLHCQANIFSFTSTVLSDSIGRSLNNDFWRNKETLPFQVFFWTLPECRLFVTIFTASLIILALKINYTG